MHEADLIKKKFVHRAAFPKKNSCTGNGPKKKFLQAKNPPPPHQFSNGPSLRSGDPNQQTVYFTSLLLTQKKGMSGEGRRGKGRGEGGGGSISSISYTGMCDPKLRVIVFESIWPLSEIDFDHFGLK